MKFHGYMSLIGAILLLGAQAPFPPDPGLEPFTPEQVARHEAARAAYEKAQADQRAADMKERADDVARIVRERQFRGVAALPLAPKGE